MIDSWDVHSHLYLYRASFSKVGVTSNGLCVYRGKVSHISTFCVRLT